MRNQSKSQSSNISVNTAFWLVGGWQGNWAAVGETAANQFVFISPNSIHMPLLVHSVCLQGLKLGIIIWTWRRITVANGQIIIYIWVSYHRGCPLKSSLTNGHFTTISSQFWIWGFLAPPFFVITFSTERNQKLPFSDPRLTPSFVIT